jgi:hypothetical protein
VLMDKEQLDFMEFNWFLQTGHNNIEHRLVYVNGWLQVETIDEHSNLKGVVLDADDKQVHELLVCDLILLCFHELLIVVFFAIHLEHNVNVFCADKEPFSVVLSNPLLYIVVDHYFFEESLVISSVSCRFHRESFWEEQS